MPPFIKCNAPTVFIRINTVSVNAAIKQASIQTPLSLIHGYFMLISNIIQWILMHTLEKWVSLTNVNELILLACHC